MTGVDGATSQIVAFANERIAATDTVFPLITNPDVPIESRLGLFIPLGFSL